MVLVKHTPTVSVSIHLKLSVSADACLHEDVNKCILELSMLSLALLLDAEAIMF